MNTLEAVEAGRLTRWRRLPPVAHRYYWIGAGLAIQAAGVAILIAWAYPKYQKNFMPELTAKTTFMLVWEQTIHSRTGLAVCAAAAVVFAVGCVLAARPFVRTVEMLAIVVPLAAVVGVVALGALVVVVVVGYFVIMMLSGLNGVGGGGSKSADEAEESSPL